VFNTTGFRSGDSNEERDPDRGTVEAEEMPHGAVLSEGLPMVARNHDHGVFIASSRLDPVDHLGDLTRQLTTACGVEVGQHFKLLLLE
jgi:hypothetical protein